MGVILMDVILMGVILVCVMLHIGEIIIIIILLKYGSSSTRLRDSVAGNLCNFIVPWDSIRALVASRLIALDKCLGVRPIGIGETLCRVIGKAVCMATHLDAALVCSSDQLCVGLQVGIEAPPFMVGMKSFPPIRIKIQDGLCSLLMLLMLLIL